MSALLDSLLYTTTGMAHNSLSYDVMVDSLFTFGLAGTLIVAAVCVLALLPWTDEQIGATDVEARLVAHRFNQMVSGHRGPVSVAVARSS
jgi:hypothetical protein